MRVRHLALTSLVVVASIAVSGCSTVKSQLDAKFTPKPTVITQEATVGAVGASVEGTIPASFPRGLVYWPNSRVVKTKVTKTPNGKSYALSMTTSDPYSDVLAGMGKGFADAAWKVAAVDASTPKQKVSILSITGSGGEGIVTVSQMTTGSVTVDYVFTPKK